MLAHRSGRSDAFGGSPIFRYVDNENLGSVVASPGAGDVSQPSYASLGPIVEYFSIDPSDEFGGTISHAWGDDNLNRSFVKVQTGKIGPFSAYVARSKTDSDLWRGGGYIDREHWEAKAKFELGLDTTLTPDQVEKKMHVGIDRVQDASLIPQDQKWTVDVYKALAQEYKELNQYKNTIELSEIILTKWPMHRDAPVVQNNIADTYDTQVESKVAALTSLLEPVMIVAMGGGVAFVVASILMPILQLGQFTQ